MNNIYFDNNATTSMNHSVRDFIQRFYDLPCNPSSSNYHGQKAKSVVETARKRIINSFNGGDDFDLIFTGSGTESNNQIIYSFRDKLIYFSSVGHASIVIPAMHTNSAVKIPVDNNGQVIIEWLKEEIEEIEEEFLVSIMLANNETGVIQKIREISEIVKLKGGVLHCDASQANGKIPIDIRELNCDLMTFSSHKCSGPIGASAIMYRKNIKLDSIIKGGSQEKGLRAGTENVAAIAGFGLAVEIANNFIEEYIQETSKIIQYIESEILKHDKNVIIAGKEVDRLPNTSCIMMPNVSNELQLIGFDLAGISVSAGSACAAGKIEPSHVLAAMGFEDKKVKQFIRISVSKNSTMEEAKKFVHAWKQIHMKTNNNLKAA